MHASPSVNPETGLQEFTEDAVTGPPVPGHKPDPNTSAAERARRELEAARLRARVGGDDALDGVKPYRPFGNTTFKGEGYDFAAESLDHFLGGSGQSRYIDPDKLRQLKIIQDAEQQNLSDYQSQTFGDWKPESDEGKANKAKLDAIQDGQTIQIGDYWQAPFSSDIPSLAGAALKPNPETDLYLAIGHSHLRSDGQFNVTRQGNALMVDGSVDHKLKDKYDFNKNASVSADEKAAYRLQESNYAQPYWNRSRWSQPMNATVDILPNGKRKVRQIHWGDITPHDWSVST